METKSRYEVIAELEQRKRDLIKERDDLPNTLTRKEREVKMLERERDDFLLVHSRRLEDKKEDIENFKSTMNEREETLNELIRSVDESLERFGKLSK